MIVNTTHILAIGFIVLNGLFISHFNIPVDREINFRLKYSQRSSSANVCRLRNSPALTNKSLSAPANIFFNFFEAIS